MVLRTQVLQLQTVQALQSPKTTYTINVGDLTKDQVKYFNLYVWFEGQDVDCYDANAGAEVSDIEFKVTGTTDEQV